MHFTALVIGDNIHDQLEKFDEELRIKTVISKDELVINEKEELNSRKEEFTRYLDNPKKFIEENHRNTNYIDFITKTIPKMLTWTYDQFYNYAIRYYEEQNINSDGSVNGYYNPNSKWDWYEIGGRWQGMLLLKPGAKSGTTGTRSGFPPKKSKKYDSAFVEDIDFKRMEKENIKRLEKENEELKKNGQREGIITPQYYKFYTYAIVKDKEWIEKDDSYVSNSKLEEARINEWIKKTEEIINSLSKGTRLTIVDCHI